MTSVSHDLAGVSALVEARLGLHYPPDRWPDLARGLKEAARELGFADLLTFCAWLQATSLNAFQLNILAGHLTIGETYFLREPEILERLERLVFPSLAPNHGRHEPVRAWSAGCCTGEEAYTLAILLRQALGAAGNDCTVLATDLNPRFLELAAAATYRDWSFRGTPTAFREQHFASEADGRSVVHATYRKMVLFRQLNLVADEYPDGANGTAELDLILCRNVLIYFSDECRRLVLKRLSRCLRPGGWLVVSVTETPAVQIPELTPVFAGEYLFFRKKGGGHLPAGLRAGTVAEIPVAAPPVQHRPEPTRKSVPHPVVPAKAAPKKPVPEVTFVEIQRELAAGRTADAALALRTFLACHPTDLPAMALMARLCADAGWLEEADDWCKRALALHKLDPALHYLHAMILQNEGEPATVVAALRRALYLEPRFILAHYQLGSISLRQGQRTEAERHFANALRLLNNCPEQAEIPEGGGLTARHLREIIGRLLPAA